MSSVEQVANAARMLTVLREDDEGILVGPVGWSILQAALSDETITPREAGILDRIAADAGIKGGGA